LLCKDAKTGALPLNLLVLSQLVPYPPDSGPKVRLYYVLRYLAQAHRITLLAFSRPDDRPESIDALREICAEVLTVPMSRPAWREVKAFINGWASGRSYLIERNLNPEMSAAVREVATRETFDGIFADQLWMAEYARMGGALQSKASLVLDNHNAVFQVFQRLASGEHHPLRRLAMEIEWRILRRYEAKTCTAFDQVVTVTAEDRSLLEPLATGLGRSASSGDSHFHVIPICVDPGPSAVERPRNGTANVLHLGTMYWPPNVEGVLWFARSVWPKVRAEVPTAHLTIAGKNPPRSIRSLGQSAEGISIAGYLPDPEICVGQASVFIVPLHSGGGMRVKILDGWRWGVPIVSTRLGAEGLSFVDGEHLLIADGESAFADAVIRVLRDPQLGRRLGEAGRRWVESRYDWRRVYPAWDSVIDRQAA